MRHFKSWICLCGRPPSTIVTVKRVFLLAGLGVLGLYGCGSKPSPPPQSSATTNPNQFAPHDPRLHPIAPTPDIDKPGETTVAPGGNNPTPSTTTTSTMTQPEVNEAKKELSSQGQKPGVQSAADGWLPSSMKPIDLAMKTDQEMGWLKGAMAKVSVEVEEPSGHGSSLCKVVIKDGSKFNIEYPALSNIKYHEVSKESAIADGTKLGWFAVGKGIFKEGSLASSKYPDNVPLAEWPYKFPKLLFSSVHGGHPFQALVQSATRPGSGMKVTLQERSFDYKGKIVRQKLLLIRKQHDAGTPLTIEVIFDYDHLLPVSIATALGISGKKPMQVQWNAGWGFPPADVMDKENYEIPTTKASGAPATL
jgi:hypothetical protein